MTRDATDIRQRLATAMKQASFRWAGSDLDLLPDSGLAHTHVRLVGHGALARIPKQSQMDLAPEANLAYRAACFERAGPMTDLLAEIETQAAWLDAAQIDARARRAIDAEIARYRALCALSPRPPQSLISFDAHPGNFMVRADGRAVLVDLEKCRYSHASLDLAHATLYTSTTWGPASNTALGVDEVAGAYAGWSHEMGPSAAAWHDWHLPLRRAMWLWSITWCAKWRVASTAASAATAAGEDWSSQLSEPDLIAHVRGRVDHYLSAPVVEHVLGEIDALAGAMPKLNEPS